MPSTYTWNHGTIGGYWSSASDWTDLATGLPAAIPPGPADTATVAGGTATEFQVLAGSGSAANLSFLGNTALEGGFSGGAVTIGAATPAAPFAASDAVTVQQGATLATAGALTTHTNMGVDGAGARLAADTVTQGAGSTDASEILILNGASVTATAWTLDNGDIYVDPAGTLEIGSAGHGVAGALTIDQGATFTAGGQALVNNLIVDNGTLAVANGGTLNAAAAIVGSGAAGLSAITVGQNGFFSAAGPVSGVARIQTGASATLQFLDSVAAAGSINLGSAATATFSQDLTGTGTVSLATDASMEIDGTLSGLGGISLALSSGLVFGQSAGLAPARDLDVPIALAGLDLIRLDPGDTIAGAISNYDSSDLIQNTSLQYNLGGVPITTATWSAATGILTLSDDGSVIDTLKLAGDYTGQQFLTNYAELTSGDSDVVLPGGTQTGLGGSGVVTVTGDTGALFKILAGTGSATIVTFIGNTAVEGTFSIGALFVDAGVANTVNATDIDANGTLVADSAVIVTGMEINGPGAKLDVSGGLFLGGGTVEAELYLAAGGRAEALSLQLAGAVNTVAALDTAKVWVDAASSLEVGTAGTATAAGSLTIDSGATLTGSGLNVIVQAPEIVDNGMVTVLPPSSPNVFISSTYLTGHVSGTGGFDISDDVSLFVNGSVTGLSAITEGNGSSLNIAGTLDSAMSFITGTKASTTVQESIYHLARLEVGTGGGLSVGGAVIDVAALVVDAGASASITGGIETTGGPIGSVTLENGGDLTLLGDDVNESITLNGNNAVDLGTGNNIGGAVSGFDDSDLLTSLSGNFLIPDGIPITAATVTGSGSSQTLVLSDDGATVSTISLTGDYPNQPFLTNVAGLDDASTGITLPGDIVSGIGSGGTIAGDLGSLTKVETGSGSVASVTFIDNNALEGVFSVGSVTTEDGSNSSVNVLDVEAGASLTAATATIESSMQIDGAGASVAVSGAFTLGGGAAKDELYVLNHGSLQAGDIALPGGKNALDSAALLYVDPTASATIGTGPAAAAGTLQINAGATMTGSGLNVNVFAPAIVDDGAILVRPPTEPGGFVSSLDLDGNVSGSGSIDVADRTSVVIQGNAADLASITIGNNTSLLVTGAMTGVGSVVTGSGSASEFDQGVTGLTTIVEGASAQMDFKGHLSGPGSLTIGANATANIEAGVSGLGGITLDAGATLILTGDDADVPIQMGAGSTLEIGPATHIGGVISGFARGDVIEVLLANLGTIVTEADYTPGTGSLALSDDGTALTTPTLAGDYTGMQFLTNAAGAGGVTDVTLATSPTLCFLKGTHIATKSGDIPVESLRPGDLVLTWSGAERPVVWVGSGRVLATQGRRTAATPVIIRKGALADNMPHRDLRVTKGHSLWLDGVLIPAEFLVNHRSILWDDQAQEVSLYHVELATHDVLVANGAPAESYRDDGNRWLFHNANAGWDQPPKPPCAEVLTGGPIVDAVWRRLLDRAGMRPGLPLTEDPDLHLCVDGMRVNPTGCVSGRYLFTLETEPNDIRLVSRGGAPQEAGLARDPRVLGVAIRDIRVWRGRRVRIATGCDDTLTGGFHAYEPDNDFRWTDGDAVLPAHLFRDLNGACQVEITVSALTRYPLLVEAA